MQDIVVDLGERGYPIQIGFDLLQSNERLRALAAGRSVCVISDENVGPLHAPALLAGLGAAPADVSRLDIPAGEGSKSWEMLDRVIGHLLERRFDRKSLLIALGGGVVGDLVGFVAAIYQRGIEFVQVPTTLLAQVDSSVGGKTAINHALGKNMVGAFHQPRLVMADVGTLATLPRRELVAGLAEVIKHGAIADPVYLDEVERRLDDLLAGRADALASVVAGSIRIKAAVVAADEREANLRAILNFGHTFGHAIEAGMGYGEWLHGEAVAAGTMMATELSRRLGWLSAADVERVRKLLLRAGLPVTGPDLGVARYLDLMSHDKKVIAGSLRLILLKGLGQAVTHADAPPADVAAAIETCCHA